MVAVEQTMAATLDDLDLVVQALNKAAVVPLREVVANGFLVQVQGEDACRGDARTAREVLRPCGERGRLSCAINRTRPLFCARIWQRKATSVRMYSSLYPVRYRESPHDANLSLPSSLPQILNRNDRFLARRIMVHCGYRGRRPI